MVKHFRELRVYREAFEAAMRIFERSKKWPEEERYSLTDQWCTPHSRVKEDGAEYDVTEGLTYPHTHTPTYMGENDESAANQ